MNTSLKADSYKCCNSKCKNCGKYETDEGEETTVVMYQQPTMSGRKEAPTLYYQHSKFTDEPITLLVTCILCKRTYKVSPWSG